MTTTSEAAARHATLKPATQLPDGTAAAGGAKAFRANPLEFLTRLSREYGDVARFKFGIQDFYLVSSPDAVRDVLVVNHRSFMKAQAYQEAKRFMGEALLTSDGETHRRNRRLIQPIMHHQRIAHYAAIMTDMAVRRRDLWRDGQTVNMHEQMLGVTLEIVAKALFGQDFTGEKGAQFAKALADGVVVFSREKPAEFLANQEESIAAITRLNAILWGMIEERRASSQRGSDLLSMLLEAAEGPDGGRKISDEEVRNETVGLLIAGHETTSNAMTWVWHLLSQHPDVESKVHELIDSVLGDRLPTFEDLPALEYLKMVFWETLRLYPSAWVQGRRAIADYEVEGYVIPKGSVVYVSQWVMHRDPRFYPDPERFDPERWRAGRASDERPRYAFFPFGGGPRYCIGDAFAEMEAQILISVLGRRWRMRMVPGHVAEPLANITLRPKDGMPMVAQRRPDKAAAG
jgi:cytochrome P450